jgi:ubiquinone/menaquinone biosynthesis C-methylase UbiE
MRRRFALVLSLMPENRPRRLLEVGFGSGIFLPELYQRCDEAFGIDIHEHVAEVQQTLMACSVNAALSRQTAARLDFPEHFFDVIVSVSALEFVDNIQEAARELSRVLTPAGRLIAVMPSASPFLDFMLHVLTGENAKSDYDDRRARVVPAMLEQFQLLRSKSFPPLSPVYRAFAFAKK